MFGGRFAALWRSRNAWVLLAMPYRHRHPHPGQLDPPGAPPRPAGPQPLLPPGREGLPTDGQVKGGKAAVKDRLVWWRGHRTGQGR